MVVYLEKILIVAFPFTVKYKSFFQAFFCLPLRPSLPPFFSIALSIRRFRFCTSKPSSVIFSPTSFWFHTNSNASPQNGVGFLILFPPLLCSVPYPLPVPSGWTYSPPLLLWLINPVCTNHVLVHRWPTCVLRSQSVYLEFCSSPALAHLI